MINKANWKIHPGEILKEEFLVPMGLSVYRLAHSIHVPPIRLNDIVNQKRGITVDTALRLSAFFGTTPQFWLHMDNDYNLRKNLQNPPIDLATIDKYEYKVKNEDEICQK